jgi:hypothetical protein
MRIRSSSRSSDSASSPASTQAANSWSVVSASWSTSAPVKS